MAMYDILEKINDYINIGTFLECVTHQRISEDPYRSVTKLILCLC